jgi:hypothetical protein
MYVHTPIHHSRETRTNVARPSAKKSRPGLLGFPIEIRLTLVAIESVESGSEASITHPLRLSKLAAKFILDLFHCKIQCDVHTTALRLYLPRRFIGDGRIIIEDVSEGRVLSPS